MSKHESKYMELKLAMLFLLIGTVIGLAHPGRGPRKAISKLAGTDQWTGQ